MIIYSLRIIIISADFIHLKERTTVHVQRPRTRAGSPSIPRNENHNNAAEGGDVTALAPSPPCTCRALIPRGCPKALKPPTTPLRSSFRSSSSIAENQRREEMESWPRSVGDSWIDSRLVARDSEPVSNALGSQATRTNWVLFHPFYLFPREQLDSPWVCGANRSPSPSLANRITCMRKF